MLKSSYKVVCILLAVLMVSVLIVACGSGQDTPGETADESATDRKLKIGNIITFASHEWYDNQAKGSKETAEQLGHEFYLADANNDIATQISVGENLIAKDIDLLILAPVDPVGAMPLIEQAFDAGIPVVTTSVIAPKQTLYVGCDDFLGGYLNGKFAGEYVLENNLPTPKALLVGLPALEACVDRTEGFKKGLLEVIPEARIVVEVDGSGLKDQAMAVSTDALTANPDVNMIMGINDDSTLGAIQAYRAAGLDVSKLVAFGYGIEGIAPKNELMTDGSPYVGGLAMFPEYFGRLAVEAGTKLAYGEDLGGDMLQPPIFMLNKDNLNDYYTKEGDDWIINWETVEKLGYEIKNIE